MSIIDRALAYWDQRCAQIGIWLFMNAGLIITVEPQTEYVSRILKLISSSNCLLFKKPHCSTTHNRAASSASYKFKCLRIRGNSSSAEFVLKDTIESGFFSSYSLSKRFI